MTSTQLPTGTASDHSDRAHGGTVDSDPIEVLEGRSASLMTELLLKDPFIRSFHDGTSNDREIYRRNLLEDVLRIRLNNEIDSFALSRMIREDPLAGTLLRYLHEEYGHDAMIAKDLEALGMSPEEVADSAPLFATELLMAYMRFVVERDGALIVFVWDWFVEWYSARYNDAIADAAGKEFGEEAVRQTKAHLQVDRDLTHENAMSGVLRTMLERDGSLPRAELYLDRLVDLVAMYFRELQAVCGGTSSA